MVKVRKLVCLLLVAMLLALSPVRALALVAEPSTFGTPIAEKWRRPFARFLGELGVAEIDTVIAASRASDYPEFFDKDAPAKIIFRIVHPHACVRDQDECMTIIGQIKDEVFVAEAMFYAGDRIIVGDSSPRILGVQSSTPISFISRTSAISVVRTAKGILIVSQPKY
ncbi:MULTISPECIES: hypothetical protein [unclassified Afipia]|uniref:hypothetical protein n=1 Tax=unclassified Afipia TaxID=2642050 RepID=UPI00126812B2|nr:MULTISPECIES: hypothetical protein [unclassified Afipia]